MLRADARITLNAIDFTFARRAPFGWAGRGAAGAPEDRRRRRGADRDLHLRRSRSRAAATGWRIDYTGKIGTQADGLFAIDYDTPAGRKRALFTQFENSDARRFIPSWDEPAYKATFDLEVDRAQRRRWRSATCRWRSAPTSANGTSRGALRALAEDVDLPAVPGRGRLRARHHAGSARRRSAWSPQKGAIDQARFALDSSAVVLREYNDYFGTPYPLPKLDNIAAPGRSQFFGAMENWGAIFTFEYVLLVDPDDLDARRTARRVFSIAAHEIAHQWFGDLVTMAWWDDLWLNEGFASWMAGRTTEKLHPEWNTDLARGDQPRRAMDRDALATTHPVVQHVETVEQASQAFDVDHLPEGRGGDPHAGGLRRRRRLARGRAALHQEPRLRQHGLRRPVARDRGGRGQADHRHRPRLHPAAGRAADPVGDVDVQRRRDAGDA